MSVDENGSEILFCTRERLSLNGIDNSVERNLLHPKNAITVN